MKSIICKSFGQSNRGFFFFFPSSASSALYKRLEFLHTLTHNKENSLDFREVGSICGYYDAAPAL